jgi:hypothetical protein
MKKAIAKLTPVVGRMLILPSHELTHVLVVNLLS